MKALYTTTVEVVGGRAGHAHAHDGSLDLDLAKPKELGGDGARAGTNPEQLFAAGYAACFDTALRHLASQKGVTVEVSTVSLGPRAAGGFGLQVALDVSVTGVPHEVAKALAQEVHSSICPYSNAIRGNVDVTLTVS